MEEILSKSKYDYSKKSELVQTIIIALLAFIVPTYLGMLINTIFGKSSVIASNAQIIVGSIVNTALVMVAINLKGWKKIAMIVTMPSISAIFGGTVLKTSQVFAMYMIPGIWLGNFAIIFAYKYLYVHKKLNYWLAGIVGIVVKVAIIFGFFSILNMFGVFPEKVMMNMKKSMGIIQAITASIGVTIAFLITYGEGKIEKNKS